jgi:hypothetical protein
VRSAALLPTESFAAIATLERLFFITSFATGSLVVVPHVELSIPLLTSIHSAAVRLLLLDVIRVPLHMESQKTLS